MSGPWWWWPDGPGSHDRPVLFFPPAGADQTIARPLVPLAGGLRLGILRVPGRGSRQDEPAPTDLTALATAIGNSILALDGPPPVLVGHSFGGLLAYATACRVEDGGGRVGRLVAVASASPQAWQREAAGATPDFVARRTERILARGGLPTHIAADPDLDRHARQLISTDVALMHHPFGVRTLACPITVIRARDDLMVEEPAVAGWSSVGSGTVQHVAVPGDHFFYRSEPGRLVTHLRMELADLDGAYEVL